MIKVLNKSFAILEAAVIASPNPVRIVDLSERFGINNATCARIIRELVDADYLTQVSRHEGYTLGPRIVALGAMADYRPGLMTHAREEIDRAAVEQQASVLLAERRRDLRYILYHRNECAELTINLTELGYRDLFSTATGLMLLAYAPASEREKLIREHKKDSLNLFDKKTDFNKIKSEKELVFSDPRRNQGICAFPVFQNGGICAVLGGSVGLGQFTGKRREKFLAALKQAAAHISGKLTTQNSAG